MRSPAQVVETADGIDADATIIDVARRTPSDSSDATFAVCGLMDLPVEPVSDVVTALAVVHDMPLGPASGRMRALLRLGGRVK